MISGNRFMKYSSSFKNLLKIGVVSVLMVHCSDKTTNSPPDELTDCIIADKAKLEEITIFPSDNPINRNISQDPVDSRSDAIIALIGSPGLKADFGSGLWEGAPIGIPFILVCDSQSKIPVTFRQKQIAQ